MCEVTKKGKLYYVLGFLSSKVTEYFFDLVNPTINFHPGYLEILPYREEKSQNVEDIVLDSVSISKDDWDSFETSWDFKRHPLI